jgi:HEAT repeat protein
LISEPSLGPLLKSFHARYDALPELVALRNLGFESEGGADPALLAVVTGNASLIAGSERLAVERIVEALLDPDSLRQRIAQATLVLLAGKSLPDLAGGDPARLELLTDSAVAALTPGLSSSGMVVWNASDLQQLVRTMAAAAGAKAVDPLLRYLFSCTVDVVRKTTEEVLLGLTSVSALTEELLRSAAGCCSYEVTRDQFAAYAVPDPAFGFLSELIAACSPLTTNLLHLAAEKRDIVVEVTMCSFSYGRDVDYSELRRRAKTELQKRGNPPYRPEAYVKSGGAQFARGELRGRGEEEALRRLSAVTTAAELLPRLGDEHETVRRAAREALDRMNPGWRGSEQAVEARRRFQSALAGPSAHLREAAAEALDSLGWQPGDDTERAWQAFARQDWERLGGLTPAAAQPLLLGLADENPVVCRSVLLILARAGAKYPEALKPLVKALWHSDARLRDLAADALAAFGPDALEAIEEALRSDRIEVRAAGVKLLGKIGDTRALAPLAAALEDPIEWVRGEAVTALNNVDPSWRDSELAQCKLASACASLSDPDRPRRQQAAATLQTLGWSPDSDNERLRLAIATEDWKTLGDIGRAAVAPILDLLGSWDATALRVVLRTLGKIDRDWPVLPGARMALPVLLAMLGEDGQGLRREAAVALGRMREAGAVEPLARLLANEDKETRNAAGIALHRIGAPGIKALLAALKGVDTRARGAAQSVIQKRDPDPAFAAVFEEALADDSPAVRRAAAQYLQRLGRSSGGGEQDPGS